MNREIKQLPEHEINKLDLFIKGWYIDPNICDRMISLFEDNPQYHEKGLMSYDGTGRVDLDTKDSIDIDGSKFTKNNIDISFYNIPMWNCFDLYNQIFSYSGKVPYSLLEAWNLQKYNAGGGFKIWHSERNLDKVCIRRHLVYMTYLNDVVNDGETEFYYQKIKIKPEKGLTLIWPADWTYTHRGIPSNEVKYICTGWVSFLLENNYENSNL